MSNFYDLTYILNAVFNGTNEFSAITYSTSILNLVYDEVNSALRVKIDSPNFTSVSATTLQVLNSGYTMTDAVDGLTYTVVLSGGSLVII